MPFEYAQVAAFEDTRSAVDALEQCIGKKVRSYRAPAFSIGKKNKWAFEVLAECGIECDASVFPATRDFGGFPQFKEHVPTIINYKDITIKEFPIPTTKFFGKEFAYSGGGYFRLFPYWFVKSRMKLKDYNMCYFHINDLIPEREGVMTKHEYEEYFKEPGTWKNRHMRYLKSNIGKGKALAKMASLTCNSDFLSIAQAEQKINWEQVKRVRL